MSAFSRSVILLRAVFYVIISLSYTSSDEFELESELPYDCGFASITIDKSNEISDNETFGTWPWVGALFFTVNGSKSILGNTILIHERITLASLRQTFHKSNMSVVFGKSGDQSYQEIMVEEAHLYTGYKYTFFDLDDISVLLLSKSLQLGIYVKPVCLWESKETSLDVYEKDGMLITLDDAEYVKSEGLILKHEPARTLTAVLCMTLNFQDSDQTVLRSTEVSEQQLCIGTYTRRFCPPTGSVLVFKREAVDGRTQWYIRGLAILRIFASNLPGKDCGQHNRKWVMIDVAQRRQFIDSHLKKKVTCGQRQILPTALIKEGTDSKPGFWPWQVAIFHKTANLKNESFACGGTSLNPYTVLTGGHCVTVRPTKRLIAAARFRIDLGRFYLYGDELTAQTRYVRRVILHPTYHAITLKGDLALLKLKTPALYNDYVQPICLWESDKLSKSYIVEKEGKVVGWGRTSNSKISSKLQEAVMPVIEDTVCYRSHTFFSIYLAETGYCAGFRDGSGVCNGDSGGGMFFGQHNDANTIWYQRGIVSLGLSTKEKTCDLEHYIIFVDIVHYLDWIKLHMVN